LSLIIAVPYPHVQQSTLDSWYLCGDPRGNAGVNGRCLIPENPVGGDKGDIEPRRRREVYAILHRVFELGSELDGVRQQLAVRRQTEKSLLIC